MEKRALSLNKPCFLMWYINKSGSNIPLLVNCIVTIQSYYYFSKLPGNREYYKFFISTSSILDSNSNCDKKYLRNYVIRKLNEVFEFKNTFKKELIFLEFTN